MRITASKQINVQSFKLFLRGAVNGVLLASETT